MSNNWKFITNEWWHILKKKKKNYLIRKLKERNDKLLNRSLEFILPILDHAYALKRRALPIKLILKQPIDTFFFF
jgi:hypothetical protein